MRKHYFISDLHLGAKYITDHRAHERRVLAFLDSIKGDAASLFLLGDVLDYWFEYRYVVPRGHVRFFGKLAELADAGVDIHWFTGNHDVWLRDYLRDEVGLTVHYGVTDIDVDGTLLQLSHGDDVGWQKPMYRFTRWCFYNPVCQWLYAAIHPRWTTWIATTWSTQGRRRRGGNKPTPPAADTATTPLNHLRQYADDYHRSHPEVDYFVFGHLHTARIETVDDGKATMVCLGDWLRHDTYATLYNGELTLHHFDPNV